MTANQLNYSSNTSQTRKKPQIKPKLDQGRQQATEPITNQVSEVVSQKTFSSDSDEEESLQINVSIGQRKLQIMASIKSEAGSIAQRFISEQGVKAKYKETLTKLISAQIAKAGKSSEKPKIQ